MEYKLPVHTIFLGGGTPSLLPSHEIQKILQTVSDCFNIQPNPEITMEANPGTVSLEYLDELHKLGINRLSLGMQSAQEKELKLLGRQHNLKNIEDAVKWARKTGFENINLDLIFGLPNQTIAHWLSTLKLALSLTPYHLSLYALTIERGTPLFNKVQKGILPMPEDDLAADMYEIATELLEANGFAQYEISNFARRSSQKGQIMACKHNLQYWHNLPYLGFGAGAHSFAGNYRLSNVLRIPTYIRRLQEGDSLPFPFSPATAQSIQIDVKTEMEETMFLGLRLTREGVSKRNFLARFGKSLESVYKKEIESLIENGLLEWSGNQDEILRLTPRGRLLGNQVFMQFVDEAH